MNDFQLAKPFFLWLIISACIGLTIMGCRTDAAESDTVQQVVVTQVVVVAGEELVITRAIEPTPTATAVPNQTAIVEQNVSLDISYLTETIPDIDPQKTVSEAGIDLVENLFVGLTRFNHSTNQVEPALADEWEVSEDGRVWTFHLRDDIFWVRPGEVDEGGLLQIEPVRPVTASDFVFAVRRACNQVTDAPNAFVLFIIAGCEQVNASPKATPADLGRIGIQALNDTTLQVSLTKPATHFLTLSSLWFLRPLPPELLETSGDDWQTAEGVELMTNGPFFPQSNDLQVLQRNPLWPLPREGNVDLVHIIYLQDPVNALQLWEANQLDLVDATLLNSDDVAELSNSNTILVTDQTLHYLGFNFDSGVFREAEVRRAFSAAIDRERLAEELFGAQALGMRHLLPPGVVAASPIGEVGIGYSPDYARQQMLESGFRNCRLMPEITLLVSSSDLSLQQAELIRRMWVEELDCTEEQIIIEQVQFGTLLANTRRNAGASRPDVWELAWASYYPDANNWMGDLLHCEDSENRRNRPCSQVDDLIRQADGVTDSDERARLYRQIENEFFSEDGLMPLAPLYVRRRPILVQTWVSFSAAIYGGKQYDRYMVDVERKELERSR